MSTATGIVGVLRDEIYYEKRREAWIELGGCYGVNCVPPEDIPRPNPKAL